MKNNKIAVAIISVLSICIFGLGLAFQNTTNSIDLLNDKSILELKHEKSSIILKLEVANSPAKRQKGLMFVESLEENTGMFFIFDSLEDLSFWMKNTPLSLDLIYLDQNLKVVNFHKNTIPNQTEILYRSDQPAKYAIEVQSGWSDQVNLSLNDTFTQP